jgi:branched-chain amino acid transport system ATP-binding protein
MSGGEQQMVALGRALMAAPEILLVDEPSVGLAPTLVRKTFDVVADLKRRLGLTVLLAEQNLMQAIRIVDRGYVLVHGRVAFEGRSAAELLESPLVRDIYLGR